MISPALYSSKSDEWSTPPDFFAKVEAEFGPFDLDPCATPENAKAPKFYTKEDDGLKWPWTGRVWMNPPYGREIGHWVRGAVTRVWGCINPTCTVVSLLPVRTDTKWWNGFIWDPDTNNWRLGVECRFIRGRLKFGGAKNSAPFPSALVIFRHGRLLHESAAP